MGRLAMPSLLAQAASPVVGALLMQGVGPDGTLTAVLGVALLDAVLMLGLLVLMIGLLLWTRPLRRHPGGAAIELQNQDELSSDGAWTLNYNEPVCLSGENHSGVHGEIRTPPEIHGEQRLGRGAHRVGQVWGVVDRGAGRHGQPGLGAVLPVGGAGEDEIELLRGVGVRRIEGVGAEQQEAQAGLVAGEWAVGAEKLGPAVAGEERRGDLPAS